MSAIQKTGLNMLPILVIVVNNIVESESGVTVVKTIVDNCEQCGSKTLFNSVFINFARSC